MNASATLRKVRLILNGKATGNEALRRPQSRGSGKSGTASKSERLGKREMRSALQRKPTKWTW